MRSYISFIAGLVIGALLAMFGMGWGYAHAQIPAFVKAGCTPQCLGCEHPVYPCND